MSRLIRVKRYTKTAMFLHWVAALGVFSLFAHGFWVAQLPPDAKASALSLHRSVGVSLMLLVLVRIAWRMTHTPPKPPPMPAWQSSFAHFVHIWLYVLIVGNGISGLLGWIYSGDPILFFGIALPSPATRNASIDGISHIIGYTTSRALGVSVILHVAAALKHQYLNNDRLIARMWLSFTTIDYRFDRRCDAQHARRRAPGLSGQRPAVRRVRHPHYIAPTTSAQRRQTTRFAGGVM